MTETLIIFGVCEISCLGLAFLGWYLFRVRPRKIGRRHALLNDSFERLKFISYELLKRVDELDQSSNFEHKKFGAENVQNVKIVSSDSALLSDSLETIEHLIRTRKLDDASQILAASVKLAEKIEADLNRLRPSGILLKIESKTKEPT